MAEESSQTSERLVSYEVGHNDISAIKLIATSFVAMLMALVLSLYIYRRKSRKRKKQPEVELSDEQLDELIAAWEPVPLVPNSDQEKHAEQLPLSSHIIEGRAGKEIVVEGQKLLNLATSNFLGFVGHSRIEERAKTTISKYGVGSCGPRSFYGTVDVHLELERQLADFLGCEEAVLYSYGFATIASAIPAYAKRGDIIFADKRVNFAIQAGLKASRSRIEWFEHNDMADLERLMQEQEQLDKKDPKRAAKIRRFVVVEGLYAKTADLCPLPKIVELKWRYKTRIFVDESLSFGVVGAHGKGVTEHFGIDIVNIDLVMASLENAMATTGGFCCGRSYVVYHQRLSGLGYIFSASLPPLLTTAASEALQIMQEEPERFERLHKNAELLHHGLTKACKGTRFMVQGEPISPVQHIYAGSWGKKGGDESYADPKEANRVLDSLVEICKQRGILVAKAAYLVDDEAFPIVPSVKVTCNSELTKPECLEAIEKIEEALHAVNSSD